MDVKAVSINQVFLGNRILKIPFFNVDMYGMNQIGSSFLTPLLILQVWLMKTVHLRFIFLAQLLSKMQEETVNNNLT